MNDKPAKIEMVTLKTIQLIEKISDITIGQPNKIARDRRWARTALPFPQALCPAHDELLLNHDASRQNHPAA
jgi:hypothetical protein